MDKLEAMEMAAEREMGALDESHRQQTKILEDKVEEWRNESMNLRQQLAAADNEVEFRVAQVEEKCLTINALQEQLAATNEVICGMRSAISYLKARLSAICYYFASPLPLGQAGFPTGIEIKDAIKRGEKALSSSPTCPHKEEAELNKKLYAETQEVYAFSVKTENDLREQLAATTEEMERWKAMIGGVAAVCTLDSGCQFKALQAQLAKARSEGMKLSQERQNEMYAAIHNSIVDVRIKLELQPKEDVILAQAIGEIWRLQKRVLGLLKE